MKLAANAYAISPSLYDFERDQWEEQEIRRDARDAAFDDHFRLWHMFAYVDRNKVKTIEEIGEVMREALNDLYCEEKDCKEFERAIFAWFCSNDNIETNNKIYELLDKHIRKVIRKEWEREQEAA
jgi:CRISPR/Cas system CSM-associated protein Csm2 small subunit